MPIHAAHLYDAVMIYARALTEVLQDGVDPRNGTAVLQHIRGRAYQSVQGFDVRRPICEILKNKKLKNGIGNE